MSAQPHLDYDHLGSLLEFLPPEKVRALFASVLRGAPPLVEAMRKAATENDANGMHRAGHTAKGMFGNLGMRLCEDISRTIETHGRAGEVTAGAALVDGLETATDETGAMMMAWLESKTGAG